MMNRKICNWLRTATQQQPRRRFLARRWNASSKAIIAGEQLEDRRMLSIDTLSVTAEGVTADGTSNDPQFSRDGRFVAFQSEADNLNIMAGSDANGRQDIFVRNVDDDTITLISVTPEGRSANHDSWSPTISDNGRFVAFASFATDLGKSTTITFAPNVFVHDRDTDENGVYDESGGTSVTLISHSGTDVLTSGNGFSGGTALGAQWQFRPVISGNGGYVTYVSTATNLLPPSDGVTVTVGPNLYVSDTAGENTELVSINPTGTASGILVGGGSADTPSISFDGRYIAFFSSYVNLVADDTEGFRDIFVRDVFDGSTSRVSVGVEGKGGDRDSREPVISRNGRHVLFTSRATNLVEGDTNDFEDMFVHDVLTKKTSLVSIGRDPGSTGVGGNAPSPATAGPMGDGYEISDNGRYVLYTSLASNLLDPGEGVVDTNLTTDVYLHDRDPDSDGLFDEAGPLGTSTSLVSINADGTDASDSVPSTGGSSAISLSGDGRYAVFVSPGRDLIPAGTPGTGVYLRDLMTESTTLVGLTGLPFARQGGVEEASVSANPLQVAFTSFATDVDPTVPDSNVDLDVFRYKAEADLAFLGAQTDGFEQLVIALGIRNDDIESPFEIGVYRSEDGEFSAAADELLDTITISGSDLLMGDRKLLFDIGDGEGEVALPGAGAAETDADYQILFVLDHLNTVGEFDADPFNDDNTGRLQGIYHPAGGPVFVHGRTGSRENDLLTITEVDASTLEVRLSGELRTYDPADVSAVRFRGHEGRDFAQATGTPDLLLGGPGPDELRGGAGDDIIGGGAGNDRLFGEAGFDTIFDGMDDDLIDLGPDGGVVVATPGSDDIFIGAGDELDFSFADQEIQIDLDLMGHQQTVDEALNTVTLESIFDNFIGSAFDDELFIDLTDKERAADGGPGTDRIIVDAGDLPFTFDGTTFTPAGGGKLTITNFEHLDVLYRGDWIIDNSDSAPAFFAPGFFESNSGVFQGVNGTVSFSGANQGNKALWRFGDLPNGRYRGFTTGTNAPDRARNAPFKLFDGDENGQLVIEIPVNQELAPNDFEIDGVSWHTLGEFDITGGELTVQLSDDADDFVVADAIRIATIPEHNYFMDNHEPGFTNGTGTRIEGFGQYGDQELIPAGNDVTAAIYDFSNKARNDFEPGMYDIFSTWHPSVGFATDSPFEVSNGTTSLTKNVNQFLPPNDEVVDGIAWEKLATIQLSTLADLRVTLSNQANGSVVADSIRVAPASVIEVSHTDPVSGQKRILSSGDTVDFGDIPLIQNGELPELGNFTIANQGLDERDFETIQITPTLKFAEDFFLVPNLRTAPGRVLGFNIQSLATTAGRSTGQIRIPTGDVETPFFDVNVLLNAVNDTTAPTISIASPQDGDRFPAGSTITIQVDASDDVSVRQVELLVDGQVVANDIIDVGFNSFATTELSLPHTAGSSVLVQTRATDWSGNVSALDGINVNLTQTDPATIIVYPPQDGVNPFADGFFNLHADVSAGHDIAQVEFLVNGSVIDTVNQEPYIGNIPRLTGTGPVTITVVALDIFGTEHTSEPLLLSPDVKPGNVDGDDDFDANDSFLIHLVGLAGTDAQIDAAKGRSSLTAAQIRESIGRILSQNDVDGDQDFDANDSFLVHLVNLAGNNAQIDVSKGASPLTATQIRDRIASLGSSNGNEQRTDSRRFANRMVIGKVDVQEDKQQDLFAIEPVENGRRRDEFSGTNEAASDAVALWEKFREWIDVI